MQTSQPTILILTPIKNAVPFADSYFSALSTLTYPANLISIGMMAGDSDDGTMEAFRARLEQLRGTHASAEIWRKDFGFRIPPGVPRWQYEYQIPRRQVLARVRNHLLFRALRDQDWVLWLDVDVTEYPPDLIERLLATGRDIVQPHCVKWYGGPTFDLNAWRDHGRLVMHDMRGGKDLVRLDSVGGTALFIRADVHRDGLIFPCFPYGAENPAIRRPGAFSPAVLGEIETEGLGMMAIDMGLQCWGMPNLEVLHAPEPPDDTASETLKDGT